MRPLTHTSGLAALILILASALLPLSSDRAGDGSEEAAGSLPAPGYAPSGAPAAGGQPVSRSGGGGSRGIPGSGGPVGFDPLVLDLDGNGVELAARKRGKLPVLFDHDGDGILAGTGWPAPKDAFLARDLDGDGQIGRGAELFGSQTPNSGGGRCADGFAALAQEDADGSGLVDSGDPGWASLRLWRDLDGDGETDEGELSSLGDLGIAALKTTPEYAGLRDAGGGNAIAALGTYLKKDGSPGALADAVLFSDTRMRRFREAVPVPDDVKEGLPNARGSGMVRDLHEAAALSPEVRRHLEAFAGSGRRSEQRAILADLLTAWADTSPQARTLDEHARGRYEIRYQRLAGAYRHRNITDAAAARDFTDDERNPGLSARFRGLVAEWNRKIHVLEAFYGHYFYALPEELGPGQELQWSLKVFPGGGPPVMGVSVGSRQMDLAYQAYDDLFERIYRDLLFQSRFRELSDLIDVRLTQNPSGVRFDMTAVEASFRELMAEDTYNGLGYLLDYSRTNAVFSLLSDWNGLKLARDTLLSLPPDRRMLDFCRRSGVSVYGTRNFTPDGGGSPDFMIGGEAAERLSGGGGADALFGEGGPDVLRGGEGDDSLFGGEGNDRLLGEAGDDILDGGPGDDLLAGGAGADIYVFGRGYGDDVAEDHAEGREGEDDEGGASCGGEGRERIRLAGLAPEDVTFGIALSGKRHDLSVRVRDTGETLTVRGGACGPCSGWAIWAVAFASGGLMQGEDILKTTGLHGTEGPDELRADGCLKAILYGEGGPDRLLGGNGDVELHGGEGDDILAGGQGSDVLAGGPGNDLLAGGPGNDAYVFGPGGGLDLVYACGAGADSLTLFGASPAELRFAREGPHLTLSLAGSGSGAGAGAAVTVFGFFAEGCGLDRIEAGPLTLPGANIPGLLEALAPIGPPAGADGSWTAGQRQALLPLLEAYWELKSQKVR